MIVPLRQLKGVPPEAVPILEAAGLKTLKDILDLEREDLLKIPNLSPELVDALLAFLVELTEESEEGGESERATSETPSEPGAAPEAPSPTG